MSELRKYNTDALFYFPLVADGAADFVGDYTPAAGDAKVFTDKLISTNPTALILGFDSLSELPAQGAQIDEQGAGTAEGVVAFTVITSGTVGGGTAAGFFFMRSITGQAWTNNDVVDINGGSTSIADIDSTTYDLATAAGLIADLGNGMFAACLSPTEMTCAQGQIHIVDSSTKAIEDQAIAFHTYGNASALHAFDLDTATQSVSLANGAITNASLAGNMEIVFETDFATNYNTTRDAWVTNGTDFIGTGWNLGKTGYAVSSTGLDAVLEDSTFLTAVETQVWDAVLTGASHNDATSAGRRLRQLEQAFVMAEGVIATATDTHTITLDAGSVATADYYIGARLQIEEGAGAGQSRIIAAYSVGRVAILDSDFTTIPDTSSRYSIVAADVHVSISDADLGTGFVAVYTNTTTITLDSTQAPATTDFYVGEMIVFTHGTGAGQAREITAYTSGRVVTMAPALITALDTTTTWHVVAMVSIPEIVTEINASTIGSEVTSTLEDTGTTLPATLGTPTDTDLATDLANIQTAADAIPTTAMRGTDSAATAVNLATVDTNVDNLLLGKIFGVAETGTLAVGSCTSDLTGFTNDQLIGRIIIFTSGPADGEATDITDYANTNGLISFTDLTLAPENGNTFFIV